MGQYSMQITAQRGSGFRANQHIDIQRRHEGLPKPIIDRAWDAQLRLCRRFRKLVGRGKTAHVAIIAVARELAGFIWDVGRMGMAFALPSNVQVA